jgi:hypothetical protein
MRVACLLVCLSMCVVFRFCCLSKIMRLWLKGTKVLCDVTNRPKKQAKTKQKKKSKGREATNVVVMECNAVGRGDDTIQEK